MNMLKKLFRPKVVSWDGKTGGVHYGTRKDRRIERGK